MALGILHLMLIYLFLRDWQSFTTAFGFVSWVGSILFGMIMLLFHRTTNALMGNSLSIRLVRSSTLMVTAIGLTAYLIEGITYLIA
ncbi:hypothetical protein D5E69_05805 [Rossellomorea marisflavi]|uniref:hypothetical protein n=1 Tax=Rossellomorea marisflavi TaxID=189381 RepID=UPI0013172D9E|nr:hypothetical protein [Rossellomorea marisflavi]QHA35383.1 hypothetical protein D5E69_05805 [Rossellomorea marisflavi]